MAEGTLPPAALQQPVRHKYLINPSEMLDTNNFENGNHNVVKLYFSSNYIFGAVILLLGMAQLIAVCIAYMRACINATYLFTLYEYSGHALMLCVL